MVSHTYARTELRKTLNKLDPKHDKITFEMSRFRHAVINATDTCKAIQQLHYTCLPKEELLQCRFIFKTKLVFTEYNHKTGMVHVVDEDKKFDIPAEELPDLLKQLQPKYKIIIKKKAV